MIGAAPQKRPVEQADRWVRILRVLTLLVAVGFVLVYAVLAAARVAYPYDLEFMEDGMAMEALRFAQGLPVFVPPNAVFVPHIYMPLYPWLGGLILQVAGLLLEPASVAASSLFWLRLLSVTSTLATAALIYCIARREGAGRGLAFVSAGLFLAGFRIAGGWYELARVDALNVTLTLAGVAVAVYAKDRWTGLVGSALLLALAFLAKQTGLVFALAVGAYLLLAVGRRAWPYLATFAVAAALPVLLLQRASQGWFATYVFDIATSSPLELRRLLYTVAVEFLGDMAVLTAGLVILSAGLVLGGLKSGRAILQDRLAAARGLLVDHPWPWFIVLAALLAVAGRTSVGGDRNHLILAYAFLCLVPALLMQESQAWSGSRGRLLRGGIWLALLAQFALAMVNPVYSLLGYQRTDSYLPGPALRASGDRFIARLVASPGPVFVMNHPLYALLAGQEPSVQVQPLWHARHRGQDPLPADLVQRIESGYYAAIISDESEYFETEPALVELVEANYAMAERLGASQAPTTLNGFIVRPKIVYVPK